MSSSSSFGHSIQSRHYREIRERLIALQEVALLDVREEALHAEGHPLFAVNIPLSRLELVIYSRLPRLDVPVVAIDGGEGLAEIAARRLKGMGYSDVSVFKGGVAAWKSAGGELFVDVNVPSKAFGELMESVCRTPSLSAEEVKSLAKDNIDHVILDVRPFDEYHTMCIPGGISVPGAELALRVRDLAPHPETTIVVNCAGRTRGLIGTQSLINAGVPNPVRALRNGTIGWTLANQQLELGQNRSYKSFEMASLVGSVERARALADRAGVGRASASDISEWTLQQGRTTYFFDVRSVDEYTCGHVHGFTGVPGGQLVQELETYAPVRGARIVLIDDDGVRANMTGSWLAQMAWEVLVADGYNASHFSETGAAPRRLPAVPYNRMVGVDTLADWLDGDGNRPVIIDLSTHLAYTRGHIPGAWFLIRSLIPSSVGRLPKAQRYVVTCADGILANYAAPELADRLAGDIFVLVEGNAAWAEIGREFRGGDENIASELIDRYRRPYLGTGVSNAAMRAYLDWEFGLVDQLERDGTHHFKPLVPA